MRDTTWCRGFHVGMCGALRWWCGLCSSAFRETRVAFVGVVGSVRETGNAFVGVVGVARETGVAFAGVNGPVLGLWGRALVSGQVLWSGVIVLCPSGWVMR